MPVFGDFDEVDDYHTAVNAVRDATEAFMALPGTVRDRFRNSPQEFIEFCSDRRNLDEARKLGLVPGLPRPDIHRLPDPPAPPVDFKSYPAPAPQQLPASITTPNPTTTP